MHINLVFDHDAPTLSESLGITKEQKRKQREFLIFHCINLANNMLNQLLEGCTTEEEALENIRNKNVESKIDVFRTTHIIELANNSDIFTPAGLFFSYLCFHDNVDNLLNATKQCYFLKFISEEEQSKRIKTVKMAEVTLVLKEKLKESNSKKDISLIDIVNDASLFRRALLVNKSNNFEHYYTMLLNTYGEASSEGDNILKSINFNEED